MKITKIYAVILAFCFLFNSLITANASFVYTDQDTGTSFTVPEDWKEKEMLTNEVDSLDVKFVPSHGNDSMIAYGSIDYWETLSDFDKSGYNRSDYNNAMFTESDIAEMYNTTTDMLSMITYNEIEYFRVDMEANVELNGVEFKIIPTVLMRFDNGWCYIFYLYRDTEASESKCFADFEKL